MKKKAALITIYNVPNYGSVLQTFATIKLLESFGYDIDLINYNYPNEWHFAHGFKRYRKSILKKIIVWFSEKTGLISKHRFKRRLEKFRSKHFPLTCPYFSLEELSNENWEKYDIVITGSDQVWNPRFLHGDSVFMLSFVPDSIKKISISSSFACDAIPENLVVKYSRYLSRYNAITVRERNGLNIIKNQLKLSVESNLLLDPTLLLSKKDWLRLFNIHLKKVKQKYLLLYILDYAFDPSPYIYDIAEFFSKKYDLEIKVISENKSSAANNLKMNFKFHGGSSPKKFIELFAKASMVITSSFHGTAFAVNFGIPLISVVPEEKDDRQSSLLRQLSLENNIAPVETNPMNLDPFFHKPEIESQLYQIRDKNKKTISGILSD